MRYDNIANVINQNDIIRKQLMYNIPIDIDSDSFFFVSNPDRITYNLVKVSEQFYNDGRLWWIIAKANSVKHPYNFNEETILIPKDISKIISEIR